MQEVLRIIMGFPPKSEFYFIHSEMKDGCILTSNYFPDISRGDQPIYSEEEAWQLAEAFAAKTVDRYVNIYVVDSYYVPVEGYKKRLIRNRSEEKDTHQA